MTVETRYELAREFASTGMNEKAARIMAAALELFAEKGYAATSVREIVQQADVTNPMLYYYFESKKGVFGALIDFLFRSMEEEVRQIVEADVDFRTKLRGVARAHFDGCREAPQILRFIYSVIFGPRRSRPEFDVICTYEAVQDMVASVVEDAIHNGEFRTSPGFSIAFVTERFLGLISNHLMRILSHQDHRDDETDLEALFDEFLGEEALDSMMEFFFEGAGTLVEESP